MGEKGRVVREDAHTNRIEMEDLALVEGAESMGVEPRPTTLEVPEDGEKGNRIEYKGELKE